MAETAKTHWIWVPAWKEEINGKPRLVRFRKVFKMTREEILQYECLKLKISADTRYKLYVNGVFAEFGPARGDSRVWYFDETDIAPWLREGENVIAVEVLRYPLAYRSGNFGMHRTATPGLFVEEIVPSGAAQSGLGLSADSTWKCMEAAQFSILREAPGFAPLMYLEEQYGDPEAKGWKLPGYQDASWESAAAYNVMEINAAYCPGDLHARPIPYMKKEKSRFLGLVPKYPPKEEAEWNACLSGKGTVRVPAGRTVTVEINAGEEMCGYLSLRMRGGQGTRIRILTSEGYVQKERSGDRQLPRKGDRCDWVNGVMDGYADLYHVGGFGEENADEVYEPFWFRTFRFVQLEIQAAEEDCIITGFDYLETGYPLEVITHAEGSDDTFASIWDISLRTLKRCMHETYMDCPFYEQLQYAMDARNEILYTYMISADDRLARQCMDDFRRSQRADGMINCCYPHYGPNVIPGFSIYYIMMVYDHMMYFGDKKLVRHHMAAIDQILEYFDNHLESRGIVGRTGGMIFERYWSFIDWALPWDKTVGMPPSGLKGPITMESLLYIMGLQHAAKLCEYIGRYDTAREYMDRAESVQKAVNAYCRDEEGIYLDGPGVYEYSQHCQVFAVLTDTVSLAEGRKLLGKTLKEQEKYAQCSVSMTPYLFQALAKADLYEETCKLWDIWRNMVRDNLTTCVENDIDGRSDCHAWGSLILYELPAVILGVRPAAPGFERLQIAPTPGYLSWAKGEVATKWGVVRVSWEKQPDGNFKLEYHVPEALEGKVEVLPGRIFRYN